MADSIELPTKTALYDADEHAWIERQIAALREGAFGRLDFVRKTTTRNKSTKDTYFTYRLVTSERVGKQVHQAWVRGHGAYLAVRVCSKSLI